MAESIVALVVTFLCSLIDNAIFAILEIIQAIISVDLLSPQIDELYNKLFNNVTVTIFGESKTVLEALLMTFEGLGAVLVVMLFLFHLWLSAFGNLTEAKDSIGQLAIRFIIAVAMIVGGYNFFSLLCGITATFYNSTLISDFLNGISTATTVSQGLNVAIESTLTSAMALVPGLAVASTVISIIGAIFKIIVGIMIGKRIIALLMECVKRYVTFALMLTASPFIGFSIVSSTTERIFKTYFKMLLGQGFLLTFSLLWVKLSYLALAKLDFADFYAIILLIAFIDFGVRFETYMKELGLDAAVSGGQVMGSFAGAIMGLAMLARNGKLAKAIGGQALQDIGAATGKTDLIRTGNKIAGKGVSSARVTDAMLNNAHYKGELSQGVKDLFNEAYRNKDYATANKILGSLKSNDDKQKMLSGMLLNNYQDYFGRNGSLTGMKFGNLSMDGNGNIAGRATMTNQKTGKVIGERDFSISTMKANDKQNYGIMGADGAARYLSFDKTSSGDGSTYEGNSPLTFEYHKGQLSAEEAVTGIRASELGVADNQWLSYVPTADGGYDVFDAFNGKDKISFAHVNGDGDISYRWGVGDIGYGDSQYDGADYITADELNSREMTQTWESLGLIKNERKFEEFITDGATFSKGEDGSYDIPLSMWDIPNAEVTDGGTSLTRTASLRITNCVDENASTKYKGSIVNMGNGKKFRVSVVHDKSDRFGKNHKKPNEPSI